MYFIPIVAQVSGVITDVDLERGSIRIYLPPTGDHTIYSPMSGDITSISSVKGRWKDKVFQAWEDKIARVTVEIDKKIDFWVEVGKPLYITDRIRISKQKNEHVEKGEEIGEVILGSLSEIHILDGMFQFEGNAKINQVVIGGKTELGRYVVYDTYR